MEPGARRLRDRICLEIRPMEAERERRVAQVFGIDLERRPIGWQGRGERLLRTGVIFCAGTAFLAGSFAWLA